jgi:hypothetical protein
MNDSSTSRQLLLAYLLGELTPEERRATEERMLADTDFSDQLRQAEFDLIDDYRAGRLDPAERLRAEAALTPEQRSSPQAHAAPVTKRRPASPAFRLRDRGSWLYWPAAAVSLAILVFCGWLFVSLHRPDNRPPAVARTGPGVSSGHGSLPAAPVSEDTAVLLLVSDVTRGPDGLSLDLHSSTRKVIVQWIVPPNAASRNFQLSVTKNGKVLDSEPQEEELKNISGHQIAEFHVDPNVFRSKDSQSHFLLLITAKNAHSPTAAEFSVNVLAGY